jgi:hypothetical protein
LCLTKEEWEGLRDYINSVHGAAPLLQSDIRVLIGNAPVPQAWTHQAPAAAA